jgi:phosphate uptake regulator
VAYSFKLITHLDRISCHSDNIASIALAVANKPLMHSVLEIDKMSCIALEMLRLCDEGYHGGIAIDMNAIMDENKKLRSLHNEVFLKALSLTLNEPETVTNTVYMILASMALEMIGDHIVEMARRIEFMRTGDISPARTTPNMLETRS